MYRIILAGLLALLPVLAFADINDVINATCLVNNGGTGVVYDEDEEHYFIITAAHCVVDYNGHPLINQNIIFFHDGYESHPIQSEIAWHSLTDDMFYEDFAYKGWVTDEFMSNDLAIVKIKKSDIKDYVDPSIVPLADKDTKIKANSIFITSGCPGIGWPTLLKGRIIESNEETFKISPTPRGGRSGSGVFDKDGEHILGIIVASDGGTVPIWKIWSLTGWEEE